MDEARKRLWWRGAAVALVAVASGLAFYAYLGSDMLVAFADVWAFCASLLR